MTIHQRVAAAAAVCACGLAVAAEPLAEVTQVLPADIAAATLAEARAALDANPGLDRAPSSVIVRFRDGVVPTARVAARAIAAGRVVRTLGAPGLEQLRVDMPVDRAVALLNALPWVEYAEPDYVVRHTNANDTYYGLQYGLHNTGQDIRGVLGTPDADIDAPEAWNILTGDANFVIAVIDSGVQWNHPDLDSNIWSNTDEIAGNGVDDDGNGYIDDVRGWDFYDNDNDPMDLEGHGTHVAGTIAAEGNNNQGVVGVLWDAQIMPIRFLGPNGGYTSDAVLSVNYAVANGATISNNSWGGGGFSSTLFNAIANARANDHLFVAAAGNSNVNTDSSPHYPSSYNLDNIISVAATTNRDGRASFSNYGATSVDIGAPGDNIASCYINNGYVWNSGTSMASPHVAGVAAAVRIQNPSWGYAQVRDRLYATARPISALAGITVTGGVVNMFDALDGGGGGPVNAPPTVSIAAPSSGSVYQQGDSVSFSASASDAEDGSLSGSIVWTSSRDGVIGSGASFSTSALSVGTHTITAAVSDSGGLNASDAVSVTVESAPSASPPATPGSVSAGTIANGTVRVTWGDVAGETSYEIRREERVGRNWTNRTTVGSVGADVTSFVDSVSPSRYRYSVRAVNAAGASGWSSWANVNVRR